MDKRFPGIKKISLIMLSALLTSCISTGQQSQLQGETLLQKLPLPAGEWDMSQKKPKGTHMLETRWDSKTSKDMVQTFVLYKTPNGDVNKTKTSDDEVGNKNCDVFFASKILSSEKQNGYRQLTWSSECKISNGYYSKTIHKSIAGNLSLYAFNRIFKSEPNVEQWQLWLDYVNTIIVCDPTTQGHACPEGNLAN